MRYERGLPPGLHLPPRRKVTDPAILAALKFWRDGAKFWSDVAASRYYHCPCYQGNEYGCRLHGPLVERTKEERMTQHENAMAEASDDLMSAIEAYVLDGWTEDQIIAQVRETISDAKLEVSASGDATDDEAIA